MKTFDYNINGNDYSVTIEEVKDGEAQVLVNGKPYHVTFPKKAQAVKRQVEPVAQPVQQASATGPKTYDIVAPLPGVILDVTVAVGQEIKRGATIAILDAMKMENNITSDRAGKVKSIEVTPGQAVMQNNVLIVLE